LKKSIFAVLTKDDALRDNFQNSVPKGFIAIPIDVLCSNFVKFGRREIGKIVRCLPEKKDFARLSPAPAAAQIASKSTTASPQQCAQSDPDFIQTGSLSVELFPNA